MAYTFKHGDRPLDDYTIQRAVGRGGFGEVYYAVSDGGREVAIKYLKENPHVELRGVSHCINLKSPHLVSIFDVKKTTDGEYCIIMEYCSGPSLRDLLIAEPRGFSPEKAAFFAREIAKGLAYLHERGIVHRDLKPGNIFYDDGYVKIGDYGLSKFISVSRHSAQTASVGTVHYMAPEIGSGNYSRGVDIYALGVILYEMLCGTVPFEGSTMAEVLMKHLTSRPELDNLPQPFGRVVRKAMEKDPKDRYQTVEEMVDDLLSGETIQQSLAGFSPNSLTVAVQQHGRDRAESPVPSPNPSPRARGGFAYAAEVMRNAREAQKASLPPKVVRKFEKIAHEVERKLAKLGGRPAPSPGARSPFGAAASPWRAAGTPADRKKRLTLSLMLTAGLSVAAGVIFGNIGHEEAGVAAGMLVLTMTAGIVIGSRAIRWFGVENAPDWASNMIRGLCSAPFLAMGCAPLFGRNGGQGLAVFLGLLVVSMFAKWEKHLHTAWIGDLRFGSAFGVAIGAVVATMIACAPAQVDPDYFVPLAACVAGAVCLIVQTLGWGPWQERAVATDAADQSADRGPDAYRASPPPPPTAPFAAPTPSGFAMKMEGSSRGLPIPRWAIARAFWGLVAFALMGGTIVTFLIPLIASDWDYHDITVAVVMCTAFASFTIFAMRKMGPLKRVGFWRETLRPFLISASLFGIGGNITGIAREWNCPCEPCEMEYEYDHEPEDAEAEVRMGEFAEVRARVNEAKHRIETHIGAGPFAFHSQEWRMKGHRMGDEGRISMVAGLILSSMAFLYLSLFTGGAPRPIAFLNSGSAAADLPAESPSSVKPHRGTMVLVFGILALMTMFFPFGIVAWVMGARDLPLMSAGRMDRDGMGMTQAGKVFGMICVFVNIVAAVCLLAWIFIVVISG